MKHYKLFKEIIKLSVANKWEDVKKEWVLDHIYSAMQAQTCLCGHFPIIEICVIKNIKNNEQALVGNCCINKFLGIGSNKIFSALKKIRKDIHRSVNKDLISFAYDKKIVNSWEKKFYISIWRKRNLSDNQMKKKVQINKKLLRELVDKETII